MNVRLGPSKFDVGQSYVSCYALPVFHFHLGTTYCILRHSGVELSAMDHFGEILAYKYGRRISEGDRYSNKARGNVCKSYSCCATRKID